MISNYLFDFILFMLTYVRYLINIILLRFLIKWSHSVFLIIFAYTVPTLSYVHFLIDLILCTFSYNSSDFYMGLFCVRFLINRILWHFLTIRAGLSYWPYLVDRILLTVSYQHFLTTFAFDSRVYGSIWNRNALPGTSAISFSVLLHSF